MKKQNLRIFLMFGLFAILAASSASAQTSTQQTANIPFSFNVAGKTFPAGSYTVTRLNPQSDKAALAIRSADGQLSKIVITTPVHGAHAEETSKLIFNRYADQYFLSQVWTPADSTGLAVPQSRAERALARSRAGRVAPERLTVALNSRRR